MRSIKELVDKHNEMIGRLLSFRLYDKGTYADGKKIVTRKAAEGQVYSAFTISEKRKKGQPTDRVTLNDTGDLYRSFSVDTSDSSFEIKYTDEKSEGKISDNIPDIDEAITLSKDGVSEVIDLVKEDLRHDFKQEAREAILYGLR